MVGRCLSLCRLWSSLNTVFTNWFVKPPLIFSQNSLDGLQSGCNCKLCTSLIHCFTNSAVAVCTDMSVSSVWTQLSGLSLVLNLLTNLYWCHSKHTQWGDKPEQRPPPNPPDTHGSAAAASEVLLKVKCIEKCSFIYQKCWTHYGNTLYTVTIRRCVILGTSNQTKCRCESTQTLRFSPWRVESFQLRVSTLAQNKSIPPGVFCQSYARTHCSMHMCIFGLQKWKRTQCYLNNR